LPRSTHVFCVKCVDASLNAGCDEHTVPVRKAISRENIEGDIKDVFCRFDETEESPKKPEVTAYT
jgi:hypothetical protein